MARKPREHSTDFRSRKGAKTGKIFIDSIPQALHTKFRARLRREGRSMRAVVLSLITGWVRNELDGTLADSERGGFVYGNRPGDLVPSGAEETGAGSADYGQPGSALPPGMAGRVAGDERHDSDGVGAVAALAEQLAALQAKVDQLMAAQS